MATMKVFSTTQVAKICQVSTRTVCNWFDRGMLKGFRVPGSRFRRIPQDSLETFFDQHSMEYARPALQELVGDTS